MHLNSLGQVRNGGSAIGCRQMENPMSWEMVRRLVQLMDEMAEILATATMCAEEIRAMAYTKLHGNKPGGEQPGDYLFEGLFSLDQRPRIDHTTLSVVWAGKQCYLGSTVLFRLADRLARHPNHFVTEADMFRDVWDGDKKTPSTIRSTIHNLRVRLQEVGMDDLAAAIQCEGGMYAMLLGQGR